MTTWRARTHQQCDSALLVTCHTKGTIPERTGALASAWGARLMAAAYDGLNSDLGAVKVQVGTRWRRAALVLIPGAVDDRAVWMLRRGTGTEQA